jgi:voltage-gated potassium channel
MTPPPRERPSGTGSRIRELRRPNLIERRTSSFLRKPTSVRAAVSVIVTATAVVVVVGGVLMRLIDHKEYANVFVGMWWAIQTVTTVGYGDVTPAAVSGRLVATFVMFEGIAFLAIITATITATFVARAQRERLEAEGRTHDDDEQRLHDRFDEVTSRLDRIEATLRELSKT